MTRLSGAAGGGGRQGHPQAAINRHDTAAAPMTDLLAEIAADSGNLEVVAEDRAGHQPTSSS